MWLWALRKAFRWKWWIAVIGLVLYFIKWLNIECKIDSSRRMQRSFSDCHINQNAFSCQRWRENSQNSRDALCGDMLQAHVVCVCVCVRHCRMGIYLFRNLPQPLLVHSVPYFHSCIPADCIQFTRIAFPFFYFTCLGLWKTFSPYLKGGILTETCADDIRKMDKHPSHSWETLLFRYPWW